MDLTVKIVIVDESPVRSAILEEGLREAGFTDVVRIAEMTNLLARIYQIDPDVILIDLENPSRDVLEQMFQVSRIVKRPIAMFVDQSDTASIQASVDAGVASYIVDGLKKERIKYILDTCISRFNAFSRAAGRTRPHQERAGRAQGDRPRQGNIDDGQENVRGTGLCAAPLHGNEGEQEDRRNRAIGHHRRGDVQMTDGKRIRVGFIPLADATALIVAVDKGFTAEEGVDVELVREVSWSNVRDKLNIGLFDAAHLLAPVAIASSLGLGHVKVPIITAFGLGLNGNAITVSPALYAALKNAADGDIADPMVSARALARVVMDRKARGEEPLTFGMTFPYSTHNYQLRFWMAAGGVDPDQDVRLIVLPPPYMVESLANKHVDAFCVGAPWNSVAVDLGIGHILHFVSEILQRAAEKVLAVRARWAEDNPDVFRQAGARAWPRRRVRRGREQSRRGCPHPVGARPYRGRARSDPPHPRRQAQGRA